MSADESRDAVAAAARRAAAIAAVVDRDLSPIVRRIGALVRLDSGADAPVGRERVADLIGEWAGEAGCEVEYMPGTGGTSIVATLPGAGTARLALIGHYDTAYSAGVAMERGFEVRDRIGVGPGAAHMKGGVVLALEALAALREDERPFAAVELHCAPDKETRPEGPFVTLERVRGADAALVLDHARGSGDLILDRKSQCALRLLARGRGARAGEHPEQRRSALLALCREVLRCDDLNGLRDGLVVTTGALSAGLSGDTVAAEAEAEIDLRAWATADVVWALEQVRGTGTYDGVTFEADGVSLWPAMVADHHTRRIYNVAAQIAAAVETPIGARRVGTVSDGCWTAAAGVPTIDGLGPLGGNAYSPEEFIEVVSIPERCGLLVGLITALGALAGEDHDVLAADRVD